MNEFGWHAAVWRQNRLDKHIVLASQLTDLLLLLVDVSLHRLSWQRSSALSGSDLSVCHSLRSCRNFSLSNCTRPCGCDRFREHTTTNHPIHHPFRKHCTTQTVCSSCVRRGITACSSSGRRGTPQKGFKHTSKCFNVIPYHRLYMLYHNR